MFHLFSMFQNLVGLPLDQSKFLVSQAVAICLGLIFNNYCKPCAKNVTRRHLISTIWGVLLGFFCFGNEFLHIIFCSLLSYTVLVFSPRKHAHLFVFGIAMSYLSGLHLHTMLTNYGHRGFDISSPFMIITQKLTYLGFSYYDGMVAPEKLNKTQKTLRLKKLPTLLEFTGFVFNFNSIIVGPSSNYTDYTDFISGNNILKHMKSKKTEDHKEEVMILQSPEISSSDSKITNRKTETKPDPEKVFHEELKNVLIRKGSQLVVIILLFKGIGPFFTIDQYMDPQTLNKPFWHRFFYYTTCILFERVFFYLAWTLSDIVNNASGFGFNGYDENGNAKWDLASNVNILELETSTSIKSIIDNWHITTNTWLRQCAYDRLPKGKTFGVFLLSAFWHGFYPGYYLTFTLIAGLIYVGRGIRRNIRPLFQHNESSKQVYDFIGWVVTIFGIAYAVAPHFLLDIDSSLKFYGSFYWIVHVAIVGFALCLPASSFKSSSKASSLPSNEAVKKQQYLATKNDETARNKKKL